MCGRYAFIPLADFFDRLQVTNRDFRLSPRYNAAPGQSMPVVYTASPRQVADMRWGLVPVWAKDPRIAFKTFNARSESLPDRPAFRQSLKNHRCLVPSSGFFEWSEKKIPHLIKLKSVGWFVFAGLYSIWQDGEDISHYTFTIITTAANNLINKIHNRMPVILSDSAAEQWVDNSSYSPDLLRLLKPYSAGDMQMYPVSPLVNRADNQSLHVLDPL